MVSGSPCAEGWRFCRSWSSALSAAKTNDEVGKTERLNMGGAGGSNSCVFAWFGACASNHTCEYIDVVMWQHICRYLQTLKHV